jgi:hypothetical protein
LILGGVLPLIGVAFSAWVLIESLSTGAVTTPVMLYGLGSILAGAIVALFLHRCMGVKFFDSLQAGAASR